MWPQVQAMEISTDTLSFDFSKEDEHAVWIDNLSEAGKEGLRYIITGVISTSRFRLKSLIEHPLERERLCDSDIELFLREEGITDEDRKTAKRLYPALLKTALTLVESKVYDVASIIADSLEEDEISHILSGDALPTRLEGRDELSWGKIEDKETVKILKGRIRNWDTLSGMAQSTLLAAVRETVSSDEQV